MMSVSKMIAVIAVACSTGSANAATTTIMRNQLVRRTEQCDISCASVPEESRDTCLTACEFALGGGDQPPTKCATTDTKCICYKTCPPASDQCKAACKEGDDVSNKDDDADDGSMMNDNNDEEDFYGTTSTTKPPQNIVTVGPSTTKKTQTVGPTTFDNSKCVCNGKSFSYNGDNYFGSSCQSRFNNKALCFVDAGVCEQEGTIGFRALHLICLDSLVQELRT